MMINSGFLPETLRFTADSGKDNLKSAFA